MGGCFSSEQGKTNTKHAQNKVPKSIYAEPIPDVGVSDYYVVESLLGEGVSGQTWLCRTIETGKKFAVKFIQRPIPKVLIPMVIQEIQIQAAVADSHVNLTKIESAVLTKSHLGIVMEYVKGGTLTNFVSQRGSTLEERNGLFLSEDEARYFFKQFVAAIEHLHEAHIAHRDLKLDNIVLTEEIPPVIKLCDFGFAKDWDETSNMMTSIGTPVYMSPQLLNSKHAGQAYDATASDVWACGVLLFVMMLGLFPFDHIDHPDPNSSQAHVEVWLQQIKCSWRENLRIAGHATKLTRECVDILDKIFELDESQRISVAGIKAHPWFCAPLPSPYQEALERLDRRQNAIVSQLQGFGEKIRLRDASVEELVNEAGTAFRPTPEVPEAPLKWVMLSALERQRSLQNSPMFTGSRRGTIKSIFNASQRSMADLDVSVCSRLKPETIDLALARSASVADSDLHAGEANGKQPAPAAAEAVEVDSGTDPSDGAVSLVKLLPSPFEVAAEVAAEQVGVAAEDVKVTTEEST